VELEQIKSRIKLLHEKLESAIELSKSVGMPEGKLEVLEDTGFFLGALVGHIEVLQTETSLAALEDELRATNLTLQGLRETLLLWEPPDESLISEVDAAQDAVLKNLGKVKSGRSVKKKAPVLLLGAALAFAAYRSRK
jgi:hypothetical protein